MIEDMRRQRWSALMNGIVIGFGINGLLLGLPLAILPLAAGIFLEWRARSKLSKV